jgi:hypothetical protein
MITVAFVHVGKDDFLPRAMTRSVRAAMPDARIVHLTDTETPAVIGADAVERRPYDGSHLMTFRLAHFAHMPPCDVVFLDTDVIVQRDLAPLFASGFDIALTRRSDIGLDPQGVDVAAAMPYNTGVMLGRPSGRDFWQNALRVCEGFEDDAQRWWGDQFAVKMVAEVAPIRILDLPCDPYNYSPSTENEDVSGKFVVHYKGPRKAWMTRRAQAAYAMRP